MFETSAKLKNFILWCQKNKIKSFKCKDIEFELSELAFVPEIGNFEEIKMDDKATFSDLSHLSKDEADETLFWSTNTTTQG